MGAESSEVQMARLDERLKSIMTALDEARVSRKHQYEQMEEYGKSLTSIDGRVKSVEASLAKSAPTIEEFITIKHKVVGAGLAGKWLWAAGGVLLSAAIFLSEKWQSWMK
jgi:predicted phage tail protein